MTVLLRVRLLCRLHALTVLVNTFSIFVLSNIDIVMICRFLLDSLHSAARMSTARSDDGSGVVTMSSMSDLAREEYVFSQSVIVDAFVSGCLL